MDPNTLKIIIGFRIIEGRWALGLSQAALAKLCGYDRSYLNRIEKGKHLAETKTLNKISEKLHVPEWKLLKPWRNTPKKIKEFRFYIKLYKGKLPEWILKKMEKKS
jgi:transcriptional regulator with XRE-family HTH domain